MIHHNQIQNHEVEKTITKKLTAAFLLGATALVASIALFAYTRNSHEEIKLSQEYIALFTNNRDGTCRIVRENVTGPAYINFGGVYHQLNKANIDSLFIADFWAGVGSIPQENIGLPLDENAHLAKIPGESQIYLINGKAKRPIEDDETFNKCTFDVSKIRQENIIANYSTGQIIGLKGQRYLDCTYYRVGEKVKVILGGVIREFYSGTIYQDFTGKNKELVEIFPTDPNYSLGPLMVSTPSVVRIIESGDYYFVTSYDYHKFSNEESLEALDFNRRKLLEWSYAELISLGKNRLPDIDITKKY